MNLLEKSIYRSIGSPKGMDVKVLDGKVILTIYKGNNFEKTINRGVEYSRLLTLGKEHYREYKKTKARLKYLESLIKVDM